LFNESSSEKIGSWNVKGAVKMSKKITERHGSKPYGFYFERYKEPAPLKSGGDTFKVEPKLVKRSGTYYLTGKVMTLKDIPDTDDTRILRSNMECNGIKAVVENNNSWRHTGEFNKGDVVVDWDGKVLDRGSNYQ